MKLTEVLSKNRGSKYGEIDIDANIIIASDGYKFVDTIRVIYQVGDVRVIDQLFAYNQLNELKIALNEFFEHLDAHMKGS